MACTLAISTFWKISMHASCLAGAITSLAILVTPWASVLALSLPPTAWSRMLLKHHTATQVAVGAALGGLVAVVALADLH
jgi:membrane-associated phospholipid phosphatase